MEAGADRIRDEGGGEPGRHRVLGPPSGAVRGHEHVHAADRPDQAVDPRDSGHVVTNGPVIDPPDSSLRGLTFYRTGSLEESRQLAEADPAVRAGRLAIEIMTWYCPPGTMSKPGRPVTV
jgi:hypothetical protein